MRKPNAMLKLRQGALLRRHIIAVLTSQCVLLSWRGAIATSTGFTTCLPNIAQISSHSCKSPRTPPSLLHPRPIQPSNGLFQSPQPQPPGPPTPGRSLAARGPPQCRLGSRRPAQPCRVRCRGAGGGGEVTPFDRRTRWPDSLPGTESKEKNRTSTGGPP